MTSHALLRAEAVDTAPFDRRPRWSSARSLERRPPGSDRETPAAGPSARLAEADLPFHSLPDDRALPRNIALGRILIVDAEPSTRSDVAAFFDRHDAAVTFISDARHALHHLDTGGFSLVILDLDLRIHDGFGLLRLIRQRSDIPIILVSAEHYDAVDRVIGLELGADDCLCKPVGLHELVARARATLRRQEVGRQSLRHPTARGGYRFAGWEVRRKTRVLMNPQGEGVPLTKTEFSVLAALLDASGRVLSREQLLQATRSRDDIYDRSIDVQVLRLRRKMEAGGAGTKIIQTERGLGYRIAVPIEAFH